MPKNKTEKEFDSIKKIQYTVKLNLKEVIEFIKTIFRKNGNGNMPLSFT